MSRLMQLLVESDVVYCVPGSPSVAETTVELIRGLSAARGIPVRLVEGISFIEPVLGAIGEFDITWMSLMDAAEIDLLASQNAFGETPGAPGTLPHRAPVPTAPLLIAQLYSKHVAASVKLWLSGFWPEEHEVTLVRSAGTTEQIVTRIPLYKLDREEVDHLTTLFVPPIQPVEDSRTFSGLLNVTRAL